MKAYVMYESKTGNTKKLADVIKAYYRSIDGVAHSLDEADVVFVGSWTDEGHMADAMAEKAMRLKDKKVFLFGTCGYGSEEHYKQVADRSSMIFRNGTTLVGYFYCLGEMPPYVRNQYVEMLRASPENQMLQVSVENFDAAVGHPNQEDLDNLQAILKDLKV